MPQTELGQNDTSGWWGIIRQLPVWGRCHKRNWGKITPLAGGVSSANCQFEEDATNGIVE
jgi:hypothetical protein